MFRSLVKHMGKATWYILAVSVDTSHYKVHRELLQMYEKGEGGVFKSRACRQNAHKVRTMFVVEKRRRKRILEINVNDLAPKGKHNV